MVASAMSTFLVAAILAFLLVASGVLVWDGLAAGLRTAGASTADVWRARLRLAVGVLGFGATLWIVLGMLSRAW